MKKGQMAVWVAGDVEAYKKAKPILDASYTTVMYTGILGTAMIPKVLSNMLCAVQILAMSECFAIGNEGVHSFRFIARAIADFTFYSFCSPEVWHGLELILAFN